MNEFDRDQARKYLRVVFGLRPSGYIAMAFKVPEQAIPHRDDREHNDYKRRERKASDGSTEVYGWVERFYKAYEPEAMLDEVQDRMDADAVKVMISPAVFKAPRRSIDDVKGISVVHLDYDSSGQAMSERLHEQLLKAKPMLVWSGRPHNFHAYISVRGLSADDHFSLIRAVRGKFGGDSKIAPNDLLTLPGTYNFKDPAHPAPVVLQATTVRPWRSAEQLVDVLGLDLDEAPGRPAATDVPTDEPLDLPQAKVRQLLRRVRQGQGIDSSGANMRIVKTCQEQGLTPGQTFTFMRTCLGSDEYKDNGDAWLARDVGRIWTKSSSTHTRRAATTGHTATAPVRQTSWTLDDLMRQQFPALSWAVEGLIPEGLTLLVAAPKIGKSFLTMCLALALCYDGKALGSLDVDPGEVLVIPLDDPSPRRMQERLRKIMDAMGPGERKHELHLEIDWPTLAEGGGEQLDEWLEEHPNCRMVVIDTLSRLRDEESRKSADPGKPDERAMAEFKRIADKHRVAIIGTHHDKKGDSDDFVDMVSGNKKLTGGADTIIYLKRARGQGHTVAKITGRDVEETELALTFEHPLWFVSDRSPGELGMSDIRLKIVDYLRERGEGSIKDIAEGLGLAYTTVQQRVFQMKSAGELVQPGGNRTPYELPTK